ncbi:FAD/NAD(P) binding domain-containing protein [Pseudorhizobium halotolerans]|uniref:FAD/NAD(P) binding domain-containing protein n=1 Tax=Pseudorhizobium halotolerans TaxID=1233081 RepID=A0ABM8PSB1_9HYPH|nr:FAD/NAD(P)-binding protein [Pseudorhizobium halotolerans]CAD7045735.1 FAD/NAD(P) binding domain-containing protein [Pseudorhizobium halotolerans]
MAPRIAVIGCGPTGLYTLKNLVSSATPLAITVYEAEAEPGKGTPYHPDINDPAMLSNIPSIEFPALIETLVQWLERQSDEDLARYSIPREAIDEREFYPRVVLGEYMRSQFLRIVAAGKENGHQIEVLERHRVIDIALQPQDIRLTVQRGDGAKFDAVFDHVVMATGHNWPERTEIRPGYFVSPWPATALAGIGNGPVGILGTSLSAIDALMTVATARGAFCFDAAGELQYQPAAGTEDFHVTMMSRKGLLPEADFYCPLPYLKPQACTEQAIDALIATGRHDLLDDVFELFRAEIVAADPDYAARIGLSQLELETFAPAYYAERTESDPFVWAARNLAETEYNREQRHTVPWRYAILITHEIIARVVPHLDERNLRRFHRHFKSIFVDDYATVPLMSIRRLLALRRAGKLDILKLGKDYEIVEREHGAAVIVGGKAIDFDAFIDATGQETLSATDLPFPTLVAQGGVRKSTTPKAQALVMGNEPADVVRTGGLDVDEYYRPNLAEPLSNRLYCAAIAFLLHKQPFVQGITSACEIGETVASAILADVEQGERPALLQLPA